MDDAPSNQPQAVATQRVKAAAENPLDGFCALLETRVPFADTPELSGKCMVLLHVIRTAVRHKEKVRRVAEILDTSDPFFVCLFCLLLSADMYAGVQ